MGYPLTLDEYEEQRLVDEIETRRTLRASGRCDYCGKALKSEPGCRFTERHQGEVALRAKGA